jgi:hypothetical protein
MARSILRKLARDYHEGRLDRISYEQRRRELIDEWVQVGGDLPSAEARSVPGDVFAAAEYSQPDASDLATALANRDRQSTRGSEPPRFAPAGLAGGGVSARGIQSPEERRDDRSSGLGTAAPAHPERDIFTRHRWSLGARINPWYLLAALAMVLTLVGYLFWR